MSSPARLQAETVRHVATTCLCLATQRAARALARRFDAALKPARLSNGQFSLLMALNQPEAPRIAELAGFLAMDRTTLTAALKVLERRRLLDIRPDPHDRRSRRVHLGEGGLACLQQALPLWSRAHAELSGEMQGADVAEAAYRTQLAAVVAALASPAPADNGR